MIAVVTAITQPRHSTKKLRQNAINVNEVHGFGFIWNIKPVIYGPVSHHVKIPYWSLRMNGIKWKVLRLFI